MDQLIGITIIAAIVIWLTLVAIDRKLGQIARLLERANEIQFERR